MSVCVDAGEDDKAYTVTAELPGVDAKDLDVNLTGDVLMPKGEKGVEKEEKVKSHYMSERAYSAFQRNFAPPADVNTDKVDAKFDQGVLSVTLSKNPAAHPSSKRISVKAA